MRHVLNQTKRIIILTIGITVVIIGVALLVLPGPGIVVIISGLAILATEFIWARSLLDKAKEHYEKTKDKVIEKAKKKAARDRAKI